MKRRRYELRQQANLIGAILVFVVAWVGCLSLGLVQHQRDAARFLRALGEQERLVEDVTRAVDRLVLERVRTQTVDPERLAAVRERLARLAGNLRTLETGGTLALAEGGSLRVRTSQDPLMARQFAETLAQVDRYERLLDGAIDAQPTADLESYAAWRQQFTEAGSALRTFIQALTAGIEHRSWTTILRVSRFQLALMVGGIPCFLIGVLFLQQLLTTPLHRMADQIEAMQQTGRLVKLPVMHQNELGVLAAGFNHLAEQVEEQKQRLREHIVELQRVNAEFDQLANIKDDFLATVNHQLRTPLTAIVEGVGLLQDGTMGPLTDDQQSLITMMHEQARQLVGLVENVLDLSMLKSGRRPLNRQSGDLVELLRQVKAAWEPETRSRTIRLVCGALPPVYLDAKAVEDVLHHLLRNALRYAPERSEVVIEVGSHDGLVEVSVADRGPGLSPEEVERIFQPFVHLETPDAPGSHGKGLGLAFCRQVIERHRGEIRVTSSKGAGTTVTFTLPVASPQFLLDDACRLAQEEAEYDEGQFGLYLVVPEDPQAEPEQAAALVQRAETVLRQHTHRGDRFVRLDEQTVAIVAVTDAVGLTMMVKRLRGLLEAERLTVRLATAACPAEGRQAHDLLEAARRRLVQPQEQYANTRRAVDV